MDTNTSVGGTADAVADRMADATDAAVERGYSTVDRAAQAAHEAIDKLAAKAGPAFERLRGSANNASQTLRQKADQFGELEDEWVDSARTYVRDNPLTAVAVGVLAGVILSKLTSSSR
ncbi:hypothetical protein [Piscinibacter sp. XHJ-5]|uniref:hypothetical protein n=1 Tax=Piscinibacter sp. XHJ-5 TaxID=3037797 RepID=UPI00245294A7|nr:hypothetical protein [Piscinibacter sp. XHJ-5]